MLKSPMDVLTQFPVRKSMKQKNSFRESVRHFADSLAYCVTEENGTFGSCNLILGNPATAKYLVTAHYDTRSGDNTSGVVTLLEIARTLPANQRHKVCFVLFELKIGSASYRKKHKTVADSQLVLNLDCVGNGDCLMMFPTKKLRENRKKLTSLYRACGYFGKKSLLVHETGKDLYHFGKKYFPYAVIIRALSQNKKYFYVPNIHKRKDAVLDTTNVNILRAALTTFICCDEVN